MKNITSMGSARRRTGALAAAAAGLLASPSLGQCPSWQAPAELFNMEGWVYDFAEWTPPNQGASEPWVVALGSFEISGEAHAFNLAAWDGTRWRAVDTGSERNRPGRCAQVFEGDLHVGGVFKEISRWDGRQWTDVAVGLDGNATAMIGFGDALIVGGYFSTLEGITVEGVARWDGSEWMALGEGLSSGVYDLVEWQGKIVACGSFQASGGTALNRIAWWDGQVWQPFGDGFNNTVEAVATLGGELYCAGRFTQSGGAPVQYVARWDGQAWQQLGTLPNRAMSLGAYDGALYAGGLGYRLRWSGAEWEPFGRPFTSNSFVLEEAGGKLYMGGIGAFETWDGVENATFTRRILDGSQDGTIFGAIAAAEGMVVGGRFTEIAGVPVDRVALYRDGAWSPFGEWPHATYSPFEFLEHQGQLYGISTDVIARWDGQGWTQFGEPGYGSPVSMCALGDDLIVAGTFRSMSGVPAVGLARWDGAEWSAFGDGLSSNGSYGSASAVVEYEGDLIVGGAFDEVDGHAIPFIGRWDGATWHKMSWSPDDTVRSLVVHGGDLIASGYFSQIGGAVAAGVARWDGASWSPLGTGLPPYGGELASIAGELYAAGDFSWRGGRECDGLMRWGGSDWECTLTVQEGTGPRVYALARYGERTHYFGSFQEVEYHHAPAMGYLTDPEPVVTGQSGDAVVAPGGTVSFFVEVQSPRALLYTWRRDGEELLDGPTGAGSVLEGTATPQLRIIDVAESDGGAYDCVVTNACDAAVSAPMELVVRCAADFNGDGLIDTRDVIDYLGAWSAGDAGADMDGDGSVDSRDFIAFLNAWVVGC